MKIIKCDRCDMAHPIIQEYRIEIWKLNPNLANSEFPQKKFALDLHESCLESFIQDIEKMIQLKGKGETK